MLFVLAAALAGPPSLAPAQLPATGTQRAVVTTDTFGRYAVTAESPQGTELSLIDRMAGELARDGSAGGENGRVDLFLDATETLIETHSLVDGEGAVSLAVEPFLELHTEPQGLPFQQRIETTLGDLEQRSWWIEVEDTVRIEALGRHVADLRLWRDGTWLADAAPRCMTPELPHRSEEPLRQCRITANLTPGTYRVVVYGGPGSPWPSGATDEPLWVQWGVDETSLPVTAWRTLGTDGLDRVRIPAGADTARIELVEMAPVQLAVGSSSIPFAIPSPRARIDEESRRPIASTSVSGASTVTVTGPPGTRYRLHAYLRATRMETIPAGTWWVSTLDVGHPEDELPNTWVLTELDEDDREHVVDHTTLPLDGNSEWTDRFNLTGRSDLFVDVHTAGSYELTLAGVDGEVTTKPLVFSPPHPTPDKGRGTLSVHLKRGLHRVSFEADEPGVAEVSIRPTSWTGKARRMLTGSELRPTTVGPGLVHWVDSIGHHRLHASQGDRWGMVRRPDPVPVESGMPLPLDADETLTLPISSKTDGRLQVVDARGEPVVFAVDGRESSEAILGAEQALTITVRAGSEPMEAFLDFTPDPPPPAVAPPDLSRLPDFPDLTADRPDSADIEAGDLLPWDLSLDEPTLYRVETTGLLATRTALRSRVRLDLGTGDRNGIGRNGRIDRYLTPGLYQASVRTIGDSAGHLGVRAIRVPVRDGGRLDPDVPARLTLDAGEAAEWFFEVPERSRVRLQSFGLTRSFACRLEDADGWPVGDPVQSCERSEVLDPGRYRLIGLPTDVEARRITLLTVAGPETVVAEGHGPFPLPVDQPRSHTWTESEDRTPDTWRFELPAEATVELALSPEMTGTLTGPEVDGQPVQRTFAAGTGLSEGLPGGLYTLSVRASRENNHVPYRLSLHTQEILAGQTRTVSRGESLTVSVGRPRVVEISTFGQADVRMALRQGSELLATNDDRPDDWNSHLAVPVEPGRYQLDVRFLGGESQTRVTVHDAEETVGPALTSGNPRRVRPGDDVLLLPLELDATELIQVSAAADESLALSLEAEVDGVWTAIGQDQGRSALVAARGLPATRATGWRVRLSSLDRRGQPARVTAWSVSPRRVGETALEQGLSLRSRGAPLDAVAVRGTPGVYGISGAEDGLWACRAAGQACVPVSRGQVSAPDDVLVLLHSGGRIRAERVRLGADPASLRIEQPVTVDLAGFGPTVVLAESPLGQPMVRLQEDAADPVDLSAVAVSPGASATVDLGGDASSARVWSGDGGPLDARVRAVQLDLQEGDLPSGLTDTRIAAGHGLLLHTARSELDLSLPPGIVALMVDRTGRQRIHWSPSEALAVALPDADGVLALLNPSESALPVSMERRPHAGPAPRLSGPVERRDVRGGQVQLEVPPGDGSLRIGGTSTAITYLRRDGRVFRGDDLPIGPGGRAWLDHLPGPAVVWAEEPSGPIGPWATLDAPRTRISGARRLALEGTAHALDFDLDGPAMVRLTTEQPLVAQSIDDRVATVRHRGGIIDLWLPHGTGGAFLRGPGGVELTGHVDVLVRTPELLTEGLGDERLLGPGDLRLYAVEVDHDGRLGFGIRGEADRAELTVIDPDGNERGHGAAQMVNGQPGTWLLALSLPADAPPTRVRPAVVGVDAPHTGPSADVIRTYLEAAGLAVAEGDLQ